ncbi:extracellular solute-binding protein [Patescibacteria group bacterium]|nr:extracellular solute-binding protein [Patescibacteria group bacterium]
MFLKKNKPKGTIILLILIFLLVSGIGCKGAPKELQEKIKPINLVYWRVDDGQDSFSYIINEFKKLYPHISITYKLIRAEEYEQALLEAWAEDRGPDIFSIPNTWLGKYKTKISLLSMNTDFSMAKTIIVGSIKKEKKIIEQKIKTPTLRGLRETFVEVVPKDIVVDNNKIYGLPLSLDILTMYYNRNFLNNKGIVNPPKNWDEFVSQTKAITLQDRYGNFVQSGAAIGTSKNIKYMPDIISLLMMQSGTNMSNDNRALFDKESMDDSDYYPGQEALQFYVNFASPSNGSYTWNKDMPSDLDAFVAGKTGFIFGYSDYLSAIKKQAPKLNFDMAKVPQISGTLKEVNYARYWLETVSKKSEHTEEAWAFVLHASKDANAKTFLERTKKPTAHRALIEWQMEDFDLQPFVKGVLTAQTWYKGKNYLLVKEAFEEMVDNVLYNGETIKKAIEYAVKRINLTY